MPYVAVGDNTRTDKTGKLPWRVPENSLWVHRSMTDRQKGTLQDDQWELGWHSAGAWRPHLMGITMRNYTAAL